MMLRQSARRLSTQVQRTPEEIKAGLAKVERFKQFVQPKASPQTSMGYPASENPNVPANLAEMAVLSGMPEEQARRKVLISPRMLKTLQSGGKYAHQWQISWRNQARWSNPLMGWASSADPLSNVKLNFDSKAAAIAFAERNGWKYEVAIDTDKKVEPAGIYLYKHNFLDKRTLDKMRLEGPKTKQWEMPSFGQSHFFMPLKYHGDGIVQQHGPPVSN